jgi:hypothetical protein
VNGGASERTQQTGGSLEMLPVSREQDRAMA